MESREAKWLKRKYRKVEYSDVGPSVKFSCIANDTKNNFLDKEYSSRTLSMIVREALPHSESHKQHASRNKFVLGIEAMCEGSAAANVDVPLQQQVETLQSSVIMISRWRDNDEFVTWRGHNKELQSWRTPMKHKSPCQS